MEPAGIRARMREQDHQSSMPRTFVAFACPVPHRLSIRGIAKDAMPAPILVEAVICSGEEPGALCVAAGCARIERKSELLVERVEEALRGRPFF